MLVFSGDGEEGVFTYDGVTHLSPLERRVWTTKPALQDVVIKLSESMQASKQLSCLHLQQRVGKAKFLRP